MVSVGPDADLTSAPGHSGSTEIGTWKFHLRISPGVAKNRAANTVGNYSEAALASFLDMNFGGTIG
jgi:hypothetical protein